MRVLDLFSGIGGFSIGLERAGMRTVAFCEIDPFCRAVLTKHWPGVRCYTDITELDAVQLAFDGIPDPEVICGGFPCQDISNAGPRGGIAGLRSGLWREYSRLIRELRPRFALVENTAALTARGLFAVLGDLAEIGYDAEWHCISACAIGAPHMRDRLFILAYPTGGDGQERLRPWSKDLRSLSEGGHRQVRRDWLERVARHARSGSGIPGRVDRTRAIGNSVVPQIPEIIGRAIMKSAHTSSPEPTNGR